MKKRNKALLFELNICREPNNNLVLLRAELNREFTRLDFGYIATSEYIKGGWIKISPDTYIQPKGEAKKYKLTHAENIPIAPEQFHFESSKDWQYFSLFFSPIPQNSTSFDLIENEKPETTDFNYYDIPLEIMHAEELMKSIE